MDLTMMERVGDRQEKNGRILFDRPKPTAGCSASGRRRRRRRRRWFVQLKNPVLIGFNIFTVDKFKLIN
jgi:hypothetical protein